MRKLEIVAVLPNHRQKLGKTLQANSLIQFNCKIMLLGINSSFLLGRVFFWSNALTDILKMSDKKLRIEGLFNKKCSWDVLWDKHVTNSFQMSDYLCWTNRTIDRILVTNTNKKKHSGFVFAFIIRLLQFTIFFSKTSVSQIY